jgi:hypothetical protein
MSGHHGSIIGITRFQLQQFTVSIKELAEMVRAGGCADRGGRMPGPTRELNDKIRMHRSSARPNSSCPDEEGGMTANA